MDRNTIIRMVGGAIGGSAWGYALAAAAHWVIAYAALGIFLTFIVWLIAVALLFAGSYCIADTVTRVLSDAVIDGTLGKVNGWLGALRAKAAA